MSLYYLMSQLPSLDGINETAQIPITEKKFYELCNQLLDKKLLNILNSITLIPEINGGKTGISILDLWSCNERRLRLALATVRSNKMNKKFDTGNEVIDTQLLSVAKTALEMDNPLSAEQYLNQFRLDCLESLRPMDNFSAESLFYYGLKLKLILRIRQFDKDTGAITYKNIYNSIVNGEMSEAL